jgi:predicted amidophosphoribosyltransferase
MNEGFEMINPGTPEQLAAFMLIVNPITCPKCQARYPKGTKICSVCGQELPKER